MPLFFIPGQWEERAEHDAYHCHSGADYENYMVTACDIKYITAQDWPYHKSNCADGGIKSHECSEGAQAE